MSKPAWKKKPPTKEELGDSETAWIIMADQKVGAARGDSIRSYWGSDRDDTPIAWMHLLDFAPSIDLKPPKEVWLVGASSNSAFADVYTKEEYATQAVMDYIFEDEHDHWIGKLTEKEQKIVRALKGDPELAIEAYNRFSKSEDRWVIVHSEVRK